MARGIARQVQRALSATNKEIANLSKGGMFVRGLASEGYAGGYRDALNDVLLALNGGDPHRYPVLATKESAMKRVATIAIILLQEFAAVLLLVLFFAVTWNARAQDIVAIDAGNLAAYNTWREATGAQTVVVRGSTPEVTARLTAVLALGTTMQPQPRSLTHATAVATTTATAPSADWSGLSKLTVPWSSVAQNGWRSSLIIDLNSLHADLDTAARWADGANKACACPVQGGDVMVGGYEWLRGNPAAVADWRAHSGGQDPVLWLCDAGYDSPLATYAAAYTFNRTDTRFSVAKMQYNGVEYPAALSPADCLAGCTVTARVPCASERQTTIVALYVPAIPQPVKCIWLRHGADGSEIGGEFRCPTEEPGGPPSVGGVQ